MSEEEDSDGGGQRNTKKEPLPPHKIRMTDMQDNMVEKVIRCKYPFKFVLQFPFQIVTEKANKG